MQVEISSTGNIYQRGRVSVVRLQAVHPPSVQQVAENTELALVPVSQSTSVNFSDQVS